MTSPSKKFNHLIIVVDSCRWDTLRLSEIPNVKRHFDLVEAGAQATFTYPAHTAMFQGFFPSADLKRPIYNRFIKSVYRWFYKSKRPCLSEITGKGTIPQVLQRNGHRTVCIGGVGWFNKQTPMRVGFQKFLYRTKADVAIEKLIELTDKEPFYDVINFGVTHRPYAYPGMSQELYSIRGPRSGTLYDSTYDPALHRKQGHCLSYVDRLLPQLFEWLLNRDLPTVACFCADHGDCMGEDGCYGHAFYHHNVMKVPLGWTIFYPKAGVSKSVTKESLAEFDDYF